MRLTDSCACLLVSGIGERYFEIFALADVGDTVEAKQLHGMLNRFSLRIENPRF